MDHGLKRPLAGYSSSMCGMNTRLCVPFDTSMISLTSSFDNLKSPVNALRISCNLDSLLEVVTMIPSVVC